MWKKIFYLILFFLLAEWMVSCCDCPKELADYTMYSMCSLTATPLDNSGQFPVAADTLHVPKEAFGIRLNLNLQPEICLMPSYPSLFNSANAFKCDCREDYELWNSPDSIFIFTQFDLNESFPSGSDVTELFRVISEEAMVSVLDYFRRESGAKLALNILNEEITADALLMSEANDGPHQFEIRMYLRNTEPTIISTSILHFE